MPIITAVGGGWFQGRGQCGVHNAFQANVETLSQKIKTQ